jgi:hypothetical protein
VTRKETKGGQYLTRDWRGQLQDAAPGVPEMVVCRRLADYPNQQPPPGAGRDACIRCGAPIAYNLTGPHPNRPRCCLQCFGIEPLPFP